MDPELEELTSEGAFAFRSEPLDVQLQGLAIARPEICRTVFVVEFLEKFAGDSL